MCTILYFTLLYCSAVLYCTGGNILYLIKEDRAGSTAEGVLFPCTISFITSILTYKYFVVLKMSDSRFLDIFIFYTAAPGNLPSCHIGVLQIMKIKIGKYNWLRRRNI